MPDRDQLKKYYKNQESVVIHEGWKRVISQEDLIEFNLPMDNWVNCIINMYVDNAYPFIANYGIFSYEYNLNI